MRTVAISALLAVAIGLSGCAVIAGGAAGGAVGYTAGASSKDDDNAEE